MIPDKNIKRTYTIEPYNPDWVLKFQKIKEILQSVFSNKALFIEHVGSTSIPGMSAKPLIDALVIVEKMEAFEDEKKKMIDIGYDWGENYIGPNTIIFWKTVGGDRKIENIHICVRNSYKAKQFIDMRDYMRNHPEVCKEYSDLKISLKEQFPDDYPAYRAGKKPLLDKIEKMVEEGKV